MFAVIIAITFTSCKEDAAAKVSKEKVEKAETRDANSAGIKRPEMGVMPAKSFKKNDQTLIFMTMNGFS
jgi:hypothetical protein